jgi:hypothetical protein
VSQSLGPEAGEYGVPVEAICVGCQQVRTKRYGDADPESIRLGESFKHVCHRCQTATYWNVREVLVEVSR